MLVGAFLSLVFTLQATAQDPRLDFHYNWVGQTELDTAEWATQSAWDGTTVEASGRLYLNHDGASSFFSVTTKDPVVRPHPETGAVEMIVDLWQGDGQQVPNANYTDTPHPATGFADPAMALGISYVHGGNWTICVNGGGGCTQLAPATPYPTFPVRMRISSSGVPGEGVRVDGRKLNPTTGEFDGDWTPMPGTNKLVDFDLTEAPFNFAITVQGDSRWGMVEVYQSTGNDGTLPAPTNTEGNLPADGLPENGLQAGLDYHYNWVGQADINAADWAVGAGVNTSVEASGKLFLDHQGGSFRTVTSVLEVVRPSGITGAVEIIADLWTGDGQQIPNANYTDTPHPTEGFADPSMALATSYTGAANWTICVNGGNCTQPAATYPTVPVRLRISSSGETGAGVVLDGRKLNPTTGQFDGPWTPLSPTNKLIDFDLTEAPFKFAFTMQGDGRWGMVEVYTNTRNDGTLPAPGNSEGNVPDGGLPLNGFQDAATGSCDVMGVCNTVTEAECTAAGGTYGGNGSLCPTGACDLAGDACEIITSGDCINQGGTYLGDGASCPTGACELPGGTCSLLTNSDCTSVNNNGTYQGDGSSCPAVTPILDYHYSWVGQSSVDTNHWTFAPDISGTSVNANGILNVENGAGWQSWQSTRAVVRPHAATGALELIMDLWASNSFVNYHARYSNATAGAGFPEGVMAMGPTWVGGSNWTFCVNKSCTQPTATYTETKPVRMRMSSSGVPGAGTNLSGRLLDAATGEFVGDWFPVPARNRNDRDLDLGLGGDEAPPFLWGFTQLGTSGIGMVEVYQNIGNDGTIPAPGNSNGSLPPDGLPPNGFQDVGACQLDGGICREISELECTDQGGTSDGVGTTCPTGACDLAGDNCAVINSGDCSDQAGTYLGDGVVCPTGACELPGGTCSVLAFSDCAANSGTYQGDDSACPAVTPNLDYHYSWVGQGAGGGADPTDWTFSPDITGTSIDANGILNVDNGAGWQSWQSTEAVVRPDPTTGALELIMDLWASNSFVNYHARYSNATAGAGFPEGVMAMGPTWVGGSNWTFCVNKSCTQPTATYTETKPVRMRMSSSGVPGAGTNLSGRLLDAATGEFVGDWFPVPARNRNDRDLDLGLGGDEAPPFLWGFTQLGTSGIGMVEVYQNIGNDGTIPAPGNSNGSLPPDGLPPNGLQPLTGACELPGGACELLTDADCTAQMGAFSGRGTACPTVSVKPGDANGDGILDLADPVAFLSWFFGGTDFPAPTGHELCLATPGDPDVITAAGVAVLDWNGSGILDLADGVAQLTWTFSGGAAHPGCVSTVLMPPNCPNCIQVDSPDCLNTCTAD